MTTGNRFQNWLQQVDLELTKRCGLSRDDLADQPWRDWHDDGLTAAEAAGECLVNEGLPALADDEWQK